MWAHLKCERWGEGRKTKRYMAKNQGHPMDLFPKITFLRQIFCWLGDLDKIICPWKESVAGK